MLTFDALQERVDGLLVSRPAVGFAVGLVGDGGLEAFHAHGYADVTSRTPVHPDDEQDPDVFRIDLSQLGMGSARVVFSRGADEARVHLDLTPLSAVRRLSPRTEGSL